MVFSPLSMRVMVVDDDEIMRDTLCRVLTKLGCSPVCERNGRDAFARIAKDPGAIDLVLSDVRMAPMSGLDLLKKMHESQIHIPSALMTGHGDISVVQDALRLSALDFLMKPFSRREISGLLERVRSTSFSTNHEPAQWIGVTETMQWEMQASNHALIPTLVERLAHQITPALKRIRLRVAPVLVATTEALRNALWHGSAEISEDVRNLPPQERAQKVASILLENEELGQRRIHLSCRIDDRSIKLTVTDQGPGFDPADTSMMSDEFDAQDLPKKGLFLIRSHMDEVAWADDGRTIIMTKYLMPERTH